MSRRVFLIVCVILCGQIYAQESKPKELTSADKEQVQQIQKMVDEINAMPLLSDTAMMGILYFDKQGQLRKYFEASGGESERERMFTYYDNEGDIIYYNYDGSTNCDYRKEHHFVCKGRIVEGLCNYGCGCCEEDEDGEFINIDSTWQVTNTPFIEVIEERKIYSICVESLLNNYFLEYDNIDAENLCLPGSILCRKADIEYYKDLQSLEASFFIRDSIDNPKSYILQYEPNGGNVIAVKNKDKFAVFSIFPHGDRLSAYSNERVNIDGVGSDELIIRDKYKKAPPFPVQIEEMIIWDLDSHCCLLYIRNKFADRSTNNEFVVNLDKGRLSLRKVKNGILGVTYRYKLTKSGFVLDRVE